MNVYDKKLNELINLSFGEKFKIKSDYEIICAKIQQLLNNVYKNGIVAVWALGKHTDMLNKEFEQYIKKTSFFIERNYEKLNKKTYIDKKVISPKQLIDNKVDKIIISSFAYKEQIRNEIECFNKDNKTNIEIIDIYEYLDAQGISMDDVFYLEKHDYGGYVKYKKINMTYLKYKLSSEIERKEYYLKCLIYKYLEIRDFIYAFKFIDEYIKNNYKDKNKIINLKYGVESILKELKKNCLLNSKNNIFIILLDALKARNIYENNYMRFIKEYSQKNAYFTRAYSTSIYTDESLVSAFLSEFPFENKNYMRRYVEKVEFVEKLQEEGYKFKAYLLNDWDIFKNFKELCHDGGKYISKTLWDAIGSMESDSHNARFIYALTESHPPFVSGFHEKAVMNFGKILNFEQVDEEQKVKAQMIEFYFSFMKDMDDVVLFSDHGNMGEHYSCELKKAYKNLGWSEDRIRIPIIIKSKVFGKREIKSLFSLSDLNELICNIVKKNNNIPCREFCKVQFSPINNIDWKREFSKYNLNEFLHGFEVFIKNNYKYVITKTGKHLIYEINGFDDMYVEDKYYLNKMKEEFREEITINKMNF